ncbi:serine hydrolase [Falsigemmobacter intermedius]|uniref:serine hydrolase n=1 Tax=Falsigemmobacter intermedius TaxID=1553448 RepID=UPI00240D9E48
MNTFAPQDPRDTTSPLAMTALLQELLTGEVLSEEAGSQLADWMRPGGVTGRLIRPHVPEGWDVADKSGAGDGTRNLIAILTPPESESVFVSLFISDTKADFKARNDALIALSAAVMEEIRR